MLREFYALAILTVGFVLPATAQGSENPAGVCYKYNNGTTPAPQNCCDRTKLENPCNTVDCQDGLVCELDYISTTDMTACANGYLPLKPQCHVPCKRLESCDKGCHIVKDNAGCDYCACYKTYDNPCAKENACNESQVCSLLQVQCIRAPCYPQKQCKPRVQQCPNIQECPANCLKYRDTEGCPRCYCCNDCVNKKCPVGQECVLDKIMCKRCPCSPVARCIDKVTTN